MFSLSGSSDFESSNESFSSDEELEETTNSRLSVCKKILKFERDYTNCLDMLVNQFFLVLQKKNKEKHFVKEEQLKTIFSNSKKVLSLSTGFILSLEYKLLIWKKEIEIGDIFQVQESNLKIYTEYLKNFKKALRELKKCEKKNEFQKLIQKQEKDYSSNLKDLLKKPIKHFFFKKQLISELFEVTKSRHNDHKILSQYLISIDEFLSLINIEKLKKIKTQERKDKIIFESIQKRFEEKIISNKLVRVCNHCYQELLSDNSNEKKKQPSKQQIINISKKKDQEKMKTEKDKKNKIDQGQENINQNNNKIPNINNEKKMDSKLNTNNTTVQQKENQNLPSNGIENIKPQIEKQNNNETRNLSKNENKIENENENENENEKKREDKVNENKNENQNQKEYGNKTENENQKEKENENEKEFEKKNKNEHTDELLFDLNTQENKNVEEKENKDVALLMEIFDNQKPIGNRNLDHEINSSENNDSNNLINQQQSNFMKKDEILINIFDKVNQNSLDNNGNGNGNGNVNLLENNNVSFNLDEIFQNEKVPLQNTEMLLPDIEILPGLFQPGSTAQLQDEKKKSIGKSKNDKPLTVSTQNNISVDTLINFDFTNEPKDSKNIEKLNFSIDFEMQGDCINDNSIEVDDFYLLFEPFELTDNETDNELFTSDSDSDSNPNSNNSSDLNSKSSIESENESEYYSGSKSDNNSAFESISESESESETK
ncbi:epithelial cell-transforming sequence 2 oncogene-like [Anaeramoeba flamelloides]|uniref:Epithelial cell-transforming sequence 2 oncogene-like n=1 Tax=Anaeramoeba flamelloides TaxID=1746091 RepID=A0AAV8AEI6_9EUKA|nr:epithelial cell-transforming sequence 2 oncogene-like [Anaeramoeba flamelloides]